MTEKTYGALKAACEEVIFDYFPDRSLIIRPGLIVGPLDPTDRFSYWPIRIKEGGEILAPGSPTQLVQYIDVRDLAKWVVAMVEKQAIGIYNATGPENPLTFEKLLQACQRVCNAGSVLTWVSEDFLIQHQIQDWTELPIWLSYKRDMPGFLNVDANKAVQAGLTFRPLSETLSAILDWESRRGSKGRIGLAPEKEQALLKQWEQVRFTPKQPDKSGT